MMEEELLSWLLLYVVPVVVVLTTCLILYFCSIRSRQVLQPDFGILSAQRKTSRQQANKHHGFAVDGWSSGRGNGQSLSTASNGSVVANAGGTKLSATHYRGRHKKFPDSISDTGHVEKSEHTDTSDDSNDIALQPQPDNESNKIGEALISLNESSDDASSHVWLHQKKHLTRHAAHASAAPFKNVVAPTGGRVRKRSDNAEHSASQSWHSSRNGQPNGIVTSGKKRDSERDTVNNSSRKFGNNLPATNRKLSSTTITTGQKHDVKRTSDSKTFYKTNDATASYGSVRKPTYQLQPHANSGTTPLNHQFASAAISYRPTTIAVAEPNAVFKGIDSPNVGGAKVDCDAGGSPPYVVELDSTQNDLSNVNISADGVVVAEEQLNSTSSLLNDEQAPFDPDLLYAGEEADWPCLPPPAAKLLSTPVPLGSSQRR